MNKEQLKKIKDLSYPDKRIIDGCYMICTKKEFVNWECINRVTSLVVYKSDKMSTNKWKDTIFINWKDNFEFDIEKIIWVPTDNKINEILGE